MPKLSAGYFAEPGMDLIDLFIGSEGTLAIISEITLRLIPKPPAHATLLAEFGNIDAAVDAVTRLIRLRVVPAAIELIDGDSLRALAVHAGKALVAAGCDFIQVDEPNYVMTAGKHRVLKGEAAGKIANWPDAGRLLANAGRNLRQCRGILSFTSSSL